VHGRATPEALGGALCFPEGSAQILDRKTRNCGYSWRSTGIFVEKYTGTRKGKETVKRGWIRKKKSVPVKRTTRRTSESKRNSPEMSEVAGKARRTFAGSSPERKL
jgi:hypothetical protein